jgi:SPP1 family phage portal protein
VITLEKIEDLTIPVITNIVETHEADELPRLLKLERYYRNQNDINNRLQADETKPNNKIANAYASYITDTLVGYFIGEPITYTCDESETLVKLIDLLEYNDEADENAELAKDASIFGVAYEYLYMSEIDKQLRFKRLDPK